MSKGEVEGEWEGGGELFMKEVPLLPHGEGGRTHRNVAQTQEATDANVFRTVGLGLGERWMGGVVYLGRLTVEERKRSAG